MQEKRRLKGFGIFLILLGAVVSGMGLLLGFISWAFFGKVTLVAIVGTLIAGAFGLVLIALGLILKVMSENMPGVRHKPE